MNTLEELVDYCHIEHPAGALMLVGEWGCGKTYLIEHDLKNSLLKSHILVRISLFGISNVEDLNRKVKYELLKTSIRDGAKQHTDVDVSGKEYDTGFKIAEKGLSLAKKHVPKWVREILSVNVADVFPIQDHIGSKKVVLIFDDLERADKLKTTDIFGCINDYMEADHLPVIIIANEDQIARKNNTDNSGLKYTVLKEKLVQRTVKCEPDYNKIIDNIIKCDIKADDDTYKIFLGHFTSDIIQMFKGVNKQAIPPHNLRSLKCSLQDFERVFHALRTNGVTNEDILKNYLESFVAYTVASRNDKFKLNKKAMSESGILAVLYGNQYHADYFFGSEKEWIDKGNWNIENFKLDLSEKKARDTADNPLSRLKSYSFYNLEEDDIKSGLSDFLKEAYNGNLTLNEYVRLISISTISKEINLELPEKIVWSKVDDGIEKVIKRLQKANDDSSHIRLVFDNKMVEGLDNDEKRAYSIITTAGDREKLALDRNRNLYIECAKNESDLSAVSSKILTTFDRDMADATFDGFKRANNASKVRFCELFNTIWEKDRVITDVKNNKEEVVENLRYLQDKLKQLVNVYNDSPIKKANTERFVEVVDQLVEEWTEKCESAVEGESNE